MQYTKTYGMRWHMTQHTDTYSTVSAYKSSNYLLRYFMYHLTVLCFEAYNSPGQQTSPVIDFSQHLHVTLKYTHRLTQKLEACFAQRLTKFDVRATSGSSSLQQMFRLLPKFLQNTAVNFCTDLSQLLTSSGVLGNRTTQRGKKKRKNCELRWSRGTF
jgi:hypothetical protein